MRKIFAILAAALLLGACSANPDQTKESTNTETEVVVDDVSLETLKTKVEEIATDAEELEKEVAELIDNL